MALLLTIELICQSKCTKKRPYEVSKDCLEKYAIICQKNADFIIMFGCMCNHSHSFSMWLAKRNARYSCELSQILLQISKLCLHFQWIKILIEEHLWEFGVTVYCIDVIVTYFHNRCFFIWYICLYSFRS